MTSLININAVFELQALQTESIKRDILARNEKTTGYGLTLTESEATELAEVRRRALRDTERIEVGSGAILRLIDSFSPSSFIHQSDYAKLLGELLEIFYYIKNETNDLISDEKLIATLKHFFEYRCGGDIELLTGRELDTLLRYFRSGNYKSGRFNDTPFKIRPEDDYNSLPEMYDGVYPDEQT